VRAIATDLGISDVGLAKACRRANIPRPGLGYWARKASGKPVPKVPLPARGLGQSDEVRVGGVHWYGYERESDEEILSAPLPPPPAFSATLAEVTASAHAMLKKVRVPNALGQRHPLIDELLQEEERRRERQKAATYPSSWDAPRFDSPTDRRRIRILNALFIALARCDCRPWFRVQEKLDAGVQIGGQQVAFTLETTTHPGRRSIATKDGRTPRERLKLEISWWRDRPDIRIFWEDTPEATLEAQLTEIGVGLLVAGEWYYRANVEHRHQWRVNRKRELEEQIEEKRREANRQELQRLRRIEEERRKDLFAEVAAWKQAADIRSYVNAVTNNPGRPEHPETTDTWATWALAEADRLDPLTD